MLGALSSGSTGFAVTKSKASVTNRCLPAARRTAVVVRAQQENVTRRDAALGVVSLSSLLVAQPAFALFGLGEKKEEQYQQETATVITAVKEVVSLPRDDPTKEEKVLNVRELTNKWVARYRRDNSFAGKPSYSNTYSALNAVAGHYNSFGNEAPFPKKRLERLLKELNDAERFLSRGR